jgi:hypothetical protein
MYTSAYRGELEQKVGLGKFNSLSVIVKEQHTNDDTGMAVEEDL